MLAHILETSLRGRLWLRALLQEMGVSPADQGAVIEAELALGEAGDM